MKADLSRSTFDPARHVKRVPLQQGRAQTDADANEQQAVVFHRFETEAADLIGGCGGPIHDAGFGLAAAGADLLIGAGRYYAGGQLVENEAEGAYDDQPDYPLDAATLAALGLPAALGDPADGDYLAYLDVWEWHRTALEVPAIREVALGGPDTATRTQLVWQVKLHALEGGEAADCVGPIPSWTAATAPSTGQLGARADVAAASPDPCIVAPGAGYRRLENQLYRVEVHEGGGRNASTFKWDRDNGSVVARLESQSPDLTEWTLSSVGRDAVLRFVPGDWAELIDDARELHGLPGTLVQIASIEGDTLTVDLGSALPGGGSVDLADFSGTPRVRRWSGLLESVTNQAFRELEDGVQVRMRGGNGPDGLPRRYHTGDYWTIPARTNTGDIEWPTADNGWVSAAGIAHHHCRLALVTLAGTWGEPTDCRPLFPPVTELTALLYVGGDGQEGAPQRPLADRLQVGVANGSHPVAGARVRFEVTDGGGRVDGQPAVEVATGPLGDPATAGLASVEWTLGDSDPQRVQAVLLDAAGDPLHLPVRFAAAVDPLVLDYVGGDGQSAMPGGPLDHPLQVGVTRDGLPVEGADIRFEVVDGGGTVDGGGDATVLTQADGTASVDWTLGPGGLQRVHATLISGGAPRLPVRFGANPSTADAVAYTPADDCALAGAVTTVQEALDELCRREGSGCAATIGPGPGWQALAQAFIDGATDFHLCFQAGAYALTGPLTIADKGHVVVTGCGPATRFAIDDGETVFDVTGCESVRFAAFSATAGLADDGGAQPAADHLNGVLTIVGCPSVSVERVEAECAAGVRRAATGVTVRDTQSGAGDGPVTGSTRIEGCDIGVGHRQTGVLIVNVDRAVVSDNRVFATRRPAQRPVFDVLAADAHYRTVLARAVLSEPSAGKGLADRARGPGPETRAGMLRAGLTEDAIRIQARVGDVDVAFFTPSSLGNVWGPFLRAHPLDSGTTPRSAVQHLEALRARLVEGALDHAEAAPLADWLTAAVRRNPPVASQGIVVARNEAAAGDPPAPDVRILNNRVEGCQQGIHLGASHRESIGDAGLDPPDRLDTVIVQGNTIDVSLTPETSRERHGIFVGNATHATVQDNRVRIGRTDPGAAWRIDGIRLFGHFGALLMVRQNHVTGATVGVRCEPLNVTDDAEDQHWYIADNVAPGAVDGVQAPDVVRQERNHPA